MSDRIALCGWCRTELPDSGGWVADVFEVQHHFLTVHNQAESNSVRWVYLDRIESDFRCWLNVRAGDLS
jgi:hypothetical protein